MTHKYHMRTTQDSKTVVYYFSAPQTNMIRRHRHCGTSVKNSPMVQFKIIEHEMKASTSFAARDSFFTGHQESLCRAEHIGGANVCFDSQRAIFLVEENWVRNEGELRWSNKKKLRRSTCHPRKQIAASAAVAGEVYKGDTPKRAPAKKRNESNKSIKKGFNTATILQVRLLRLFLERLFRPFLGAPSAAAALGLWLWVARRGIRGKECKVVVIDLDRKNWPELLPDTEFKFASELDTMFEPVGKRLGRSLPLAHVTSGTTSEAVCFQGPVASQLVLLLLGRRDKSLCFWIFWVTYEFRCAAEARVLLVAAARGTCGSMSEGASKWGDDPWTIFARRRRLRRRMVWGHRRPTTTAWSIRGICRGGGGPVAKKPQARKEHRAYRVQVQGTEKAQTMWVKR
ncbi:hypothetical protein B0H14DRAFT_2657663 [Mycena olivaceomarginata]|nr:hypothetical protein B0H14DRAFT_2657663 [Mycena olivaceomarginata]